LGWFRYDIKIAWLVGWLVGLDITISPLKTQVHIVVRQHLATKVAKDGACLMYLGGDLQVDGWFFWVYPLRALKVDTLMFID